MTMFETILKRTLRKLITVNNMQFGFSTRKVQHMQYLSYNNWGKNLEMHKDLLFTFVDLGKPYDRVPMDLVYWCPRKRGIQEKLVRLVEHQQ